ncbi:sigma factor-like helix-turn-helix DNA-binding protein [Halorubrum ezzemoulense]|uniref:winged helix-turn-helix transcriptional regulator n=1 Tax=Halorubrum ezzemoulense TaxID=337243 RepID=UPI00232B7925|nr:winged helix-turn-helix transcriptional regulator [Halorubrum ezzemoulense]MDB2282677.1 sigma factor-like helix-turn-helix DNA-binding protein [Halorubrum ezzemoulense]
MSKSESTSIQPKSIRQKRILETAADNPEATLAEIAEEIPSASADHVDRVLNQYGDPASSGDSEEGESPPDSPKPSTTSGESLDQRDSPEDQSPTKQTDTNTDTPSQTADGPDEPSMTNTPDNSSTMDSDSKDAPTDSVAEPEFEPSDDPVEATELNPDAASSNDESTPDPGDLTQKERETLRAIFYEPTATQDQIADMLGISRATVSNRVNAIPEFDWADREAFVEEVFDEDLTVGTSVTPANGDSTAAAQNAGKEAVTDGAPGATSDPAANESPLESPHSTSSDGVVDDSTLTSSEPDAPDKDSITGSATNAQEDNLESISHQLEEFTQQLAAMEQELHRSDTSTEEAQFSDTDLLHKVVHACMNSDQITEEEELEILETLMK